MEFEHSEHFSGLIFSTKAALCKKKTFHLMKIQWKGFSFFFHFFSTFHIFTFSMIKFDLMEKNFIQLSFIIITLQTHTHTHTHTDSLCQSKMKFIRIYSNIRFHYFHPTVEIILLFPYSVSMMMMDLFAFYIYVCLFVYVCFAFIILENSWEYLNDQFVNKQTNKKKLFWELTIIATIFMITRHTAAAVNGKYINMQQTCEFYFSKKKKKIQILVVVVVFIYYHYRFIRTYSVYFIINFKQTSFMVLFWKFWMLKMFEKQFFFFLLYINKTLLNDDNDDEFELAGRWFQKKKKKKLQHHQHPGQWKQKRHDGTFCLNTHTHTHTE